MADSKVSALTALTGANVTSDTDVMHIVDTSVTTSKKILVKELALALGLLDHVSGLVLSNNATDATNDIDIAAGAAWADDDSAMMYLSSALVKKMDAAWAVGTNQGGLDGSESVAGTPDNDTWYYVFLIRRSDTGVVDVLFSESSSAPTMPTDYDQKRLIGVVRRGTSTNLAFYQNGNAFRWQARIQVLNAGTATTSTAVTITAAVPTEIARSFFVSAEILASSDGSDPYENDCVVRVATDVDYTSLVFGRLSANNSTHTLGSGAGETEIPETGLFEYRNVQSGTDSRSSSIWVHGFTLSR